MKKILYTLAAVAILFTACNKDEGTPQASDTPVRFSTSITRAAGAAWGDTDQIGVFMKTAGTELPSGIVGSGTATAADNVLYTNSASGFSTTTPIYYPQSGAVDFVAYYPYKASFGTPYTYMVDVSQQDNPAYIDLLYSTNATVKSRSTSTVDLTFEHKLSNMVLNIKRGTGITDLTGLTVKIAGMPTKADFALTGGTLSNLTAIANITPITIGTTTNFDATLAAIVIPQAANAFAGRQIVFKLGGKDYTYDIPNGDDFISGKAHTYNITIKKSGVTVSRGDITDWTGTGSTAGDLGEAEDIIKKYNMVKISAGTFLMGSSDGSNIGDGAGTGLNTTPSEPNRSSNENQHKVTLTKDFYMGKYEVTFTQYKIYCTAKGLTPPSNSGWAGDDRPVINVTWNDAVAYCTWLSEQTGQTWRLPTEAEWEYACRAGTTTPFSLGTAGNGNSFVSTQGNFWWSNPYDVEQGGNYNDNTKYQLGRTQHVGSYAPNPWGLYDMHGNVWEWCLDNCSWPPADYGSVAVTDPLVTAGSDRVLRGGSWFSYARHCRSAYRDLSNPGSADSDFGFRVVFVP